MPASSLGKNPPRGAGCANSPSRPSLPTGLLSSRGIAPSSDRSAAQAGSHDGSLPALCGADANGDAKPGRPLGDDAGDCGKIGAPQGFTRMDAPREKGQPVGSKADGEPPSVVNGNVSLGEFGNCDIGAPACAGDKKGSPRGSLSVRWRVERGTLGRVNQLRQNRAECERTPGLRRLTAPSSGLQQTRKNPARFPGRVKLIRACADKNADLRNQPGSARTS